ncbi:MAG: hypothetical protein JXR75_13595 [Rhodobacteraceae bacterium]|nr:hypothetical protein [Paracoccaceae bacterium]
MPYAVVASYEGASKTTVAISGVDYDIYEFASLAGGSITFSSPGDVDYLIVGAGGASGSISYGTSGGGSGGDVVQGVHTSEAGTYSVTVGEGGKAYATSTTGSATSGTDSAIFGLTAFGGGYGGGSNGSVFFPPVNGGGGAARADTDDRLGAYHQTSYKGGNARRTGTGANQKQGGGGRGAGGDGQSGSSTVLNPLGGVGLYSDITGVSLEYGRGGDGVNYLGTSGNVLGAAGSAPGMGGGGTAGGSTMQVGAAGADGIVIVRVAVSDGAVPDIFGMASGGLPLSGSCLGIAGVSGAATGGLALSGSCEGALSVHGRANAVLPLLCSADGGVFVGGKTAREVALSASGSGVVPVAGKAGALLAWSAAGAGSVFVIGQITGTVVLITLSAGILSSLPTEDGLTGSAEGHLPLGGTANCVVAIEGQARAEIPLNGSGFVAVAVFGKAGDMLPLGGFGADAGLPFGPQIEVQAVLPGVWRRDVVPGLWRGEILLPGRWSRQSA